MRHFFKPLFYFGLVIFSCFNLVDTSSAQGYDPFVVQAELPGRNAASVAVALDGDTALVQRFNSVAVYVRSGNSWSLQATITPPSGVTGFGTTIAFQNNTAVFGYSGPTFKDLYVYTRSGSTWTHTETLSSPFADSTGYGYQLALNDNTLLVTGFYTIIVDGGQQDVGTVDVYVNNGTSWNFQTRLTPAEDVSNFGQYGTALALIGDWAFIGAHGLDIMGDANSDGAVMIFERSGGVWTQQPTLLSPEASAQFGRSVSFDGTTLLVGAPSGSYTDQPRGSAYFYTYDGTNWVVQDKVVGNTDLYLGNYTAISGDTAFISPDTSPSQPGGTHVFTRDGSQWIDQQILTNNAGKDIAASGKIAFDGSTAIIPWGDPVYLYVADPTAPDDILVNGGFEIDTNNDAVPDGWTRKNSTGDGRRCNEPGEPHIAYLGDCAYLFKDDASGNNKLVQNIDLNVHDLNAGDRLKLTGFYRKQSTGNVQIRLFVSYASLPEDQARVTITRATSSYEAIPVPAITLKATPTRVRVQIQNETTSGKTWFDGLQLLWIDNNGAVAPLIPLPPALDQRLSTSSQ